MNYDDTKCHKVRVLVLGDMGCSPRMRNHCLSFAEKDWQVYFSGYLTSELPFIMKSMKNIQIDPLNRLPNFIEKRKSIKLFMIIKVLLSALYLMCHLLRCDWTPLLLIQNPPAIPTFLVVWLTSKIRRTRLMVDWHNYGYTLLNNVASEKEGLLSRIYKYVELKFSKKLKAHNFSVSKAFKHDLLLKWGIPSTVLYDLPWKIEVDRDLNVFHNLFVKLSKQYPGFGEGDDESKTRFTELLSDGRAQYREDRPVILISSCSWTIDDDFETLFKALDLYNKQITSGENSPQIFCIITGKGPMKSYFERMVAEQEWSNVTVVMPWLDIDDYPTLLSSADLGICLHKSTSGLDLPMKIIDMFSVGLPVLALNYKCLHELVTDRVNGRLFNSTEGLCKHLSELLVSFNGTEFQNSDLNIYRSNIINKSRNGLWQQQWDSVVLPVAEDLIEQANCKKTN